MPEQVFELKAIWTGGLDGTGQLQADGFQASISVPSEFDGPGVGTNPEEMLLGAAATCYIITLGTLLAREGIESLVLHSHIYVQNRPTMKVNAIVHRPLISVPTHMTEAQLDNISKAAIRAEQTCMISKALRGNVQISIEPEIRISGA
jgi:peroxiredoxin-like protein